MRPDIDFGWITVSSESRPSLAVVVDRLEEVA
ncbi:MAG: hypothetical protein OJF50_001727 [Nitrospira sp.]|jgi:hypothetical protein|nr:hypothetical protein [Nitrospira sp.]